MIAELRKKMTVNDFNLYNENGVQYSDKDLRLIYFEKEAEEQRIRLKIRDQEGHDDGYLFQPCKAVVQETKKTMNETQQVGAKKRINNNNNVVGVQVSEKVSYK